MDAAALGLIFATGTTDLASSLDVLDDVELGDGVSTFWTPCH
jgi:hypothetical protein